MKFVKRFLISAMSLVFIFFLLAFIFFPLPGYIPILMYHYIYPKSELGSGAPSLYVSTEAFERQMWFLKTFGYRIISMDEYYEIKTGKRKPRGKEVLITFDDGHRSYLERALPILERYQLKSTNFLIWRHLIKEMEDYINLSEAKELTGHPLVALESHTITHPNLTKVSLLRARDEITQSKDYLEKALKKEIKYFCYPEGSFNPDLMRLIQEAGYRLAFRTSLKFYRPYPETLYSVTRIKISHKYNLFVFWLFISGLDFYAKKIDHFFHQLTLRILNGKLDPYKSQYGTT